MADLLYPLDASQDSPLPADDGVVSAAIASKAAEEAKSARDLSVQKAGEVLSGVTVATQKAVEAAGHANTASAAALQVDGAVDTVLAQVDVVALAVTAVNSDKATVAGYKSDVAADRLATQIDRQLAQSLVASFNQTWLGAFATDAAAEAYRVANNILLADGLQYFNTTSDKTRQWKNTAWSDYDATAQQSQTNAGLSATLAGMHAAAAEQYKNSALALSEQVTQTKVDIDAIRADLTVIHLGRLNSDSAANNVWTAGGNTLIDGLRYYNTTTSKFRIRSSGVWSDEVLPGVSAAAAAASATSSEASNQAAQTAKTAAEAAAAAAATTSIAGAKIASLTVSALREIAVVAAKSVELLGLSRVNDLGAGSFVGAIAPTFNGAIAGSGTIRTLTVSNISADRIIYAGMALMIGTLNPSINILKQISGETGGNGTYAVSTASNQTNTASGTTDLMTVKFVDDGGIYILPTNGDGSAAWVRQVDFSQPVSAGWWGVKANYDNDDAVALQKAIDLVEPFGGHLILPSGRIKLGSQVTIDRSYVGYPGTPLQYSGMNNFKISGYGCEFHTVGNIAALKVQSQGFPVTTVLEGFMIHHRGNTTAKTGIWSVASYNLHLRDIGVLVSSSLPADYCSFLFEDTSETSFIGSITSVMENCSIRPLSGAEGSAPYGVIIRGAGNAIRMLGCKFLGSMKHVLITTYPGKTYIANGIEIHGCSFETPDESTAITFYSDAPTYHIAGCRITNNRVERIKTFVSIEGTPTLSQSPIFMAGNYGLTSCPNWIKNPNNVPVVCLDYQGDASSPTGPSRFVNAQGFRWDARSITPVILTNGNITGDILTVNSGSGVQANQKVTGVGVNADTRILWQETTTSYSSGQPNWGVAGTYKLSSSHASPVTISAGNPVTLSAPDPFTYRVTQPGSGAVWRLTQNDSGVWAHNYLLFTPISGFPGTGDGGTLMGGFSASRKMAMKNIGGIAASDQTPYNFTGSVTFNAERMRNVRFPQAQTTTVATFFGSITNNVLTASRNSMASGLAISGAGFTATLSSGPSANGTTPETYNYTLAGTNTDRALQEMYYNQLTEIDGAYTVFLEYGGSMELSKPLRVTSKSNVGFTIDAGTGLFNYVIVIPGPSPAPNGLTNEPAVGDVYRQGGVNYTVTGVALYVSGAFRYGAIYLSGPSDPASAGGAFTRLTGSGDATITYVSGNALAGFSFTVSGITTAPVFSAGVAANNSVYTDTNNVSYTLRASSLTTTPVGYIYGTLHMSAPLGTTPPASGTLTKTSTAAGDATIAFSAVTNFENRITGPVRWMLVKTAS